MNDMIQTRDDVYITVCVEECNDLGTLAQRGTVNRELNIIDDRNGACRKIFDWYADEYRTYAETANQQYQQARQRYEKLLDIRADIEDEDKKQEFTDKYNVIEPRDPRLSKDV